MALNTLKCNHLTPLGLKGLNETQAYSLSNRYELPVFWHLFTTVVCLQAVCHWLQVTLRPTVLGWAGDTDPDDVSVKKPEPETDTSRQRPIDPTAENDTSRFLLHDNGVATMTYVARVPEALSRWTLAVSLSPADWTPSGDCELTQVAQRLLQQLQTAVDQLTLQSEEHTHASTLSSVDKLVSSVNCRKTPL